MTHDRRALHLRCPNCFHHRAVETPDMVEHLRNLGMFKRQGDPDAQLVRALYEQQIPLLACPICGHVGYGEAAPSEEDDVAWGERLHCEVCRQPIPAERLEVLPGARRCVECQQLADRGEDAAEPEYCPRCGAIMQLRLRGGDAIAHYRMRCPDCGYRA